MARSIDDRRRMGTHIAESGSTLLPTPPRIRSRYPPELSRHCAHCAQRPLSPSLPPSFTSFTIPPFFSTSCFYPVHGCGRQKPSAVSHVRKGPRGSPVVRTTLSCLRGPRLLHRRSRCPSSPRRTTRPLLFVSTPLTRIPSTWTRTRSGPVSYTHLRAHET